MERPSTRLLLACALAATAWSCKDSIQARPVGEVPPVAIPPPHEAPPCAGPPCAPQGEESEPIPRCGGQSRSEPLLLLVDTAGSGVLGPWHLYDRHGARLRDLAAGLDLEGYARVQLSVGPDVIPGGRPAPLAGVWWERAPRTPGGTQVVVRGEPSPSVVRVLGLSVEGEVTFDMVLAGTWQGFRISRTGRYLFGHDNWEGRGVVVDTALGRAAWEGPVAEGIFAAGDSAFVLVTPGDEPAVVVQPLPSGTAVRHGAPTTLAPIRGRRLLWPVVATDLGVVFEAHEPSGGDSLWLLDPTEGWRSFAPHPDLEAAGGVGQWVGLAESGRVLVVVDASYARWPPAAVFGFDLQTGAVRKYPLPSGLLALGRFYDVTGDKLHARLRTWTLADAAPRELAVLPPLWDAWEWGLWRVSEDGCVVSVDLYWGRNEMPESEPAEGVLLFSASGEKLLGLPPPRGASALDRTGRLYAQVEPAPQAPARVAIADLEERQVRWIESGMQAPFATFVHASR